MVEATVDFVIFVDMPSIPAARAKQRVVKRVGKWLSQQRRLTLGAFLQYLYRLTSPNYRGTKLKGLARRE